jgi:hypothetical protein
VQISRCVLRFLPIGACNWELHVLEWLHCFINLPHIRCNGTEDHKKKLYVVDCKSEGGCLTYQWWSVRWYLIFWLWQGQPFPSSIASNIMVGNLGLVYCPKYLWVKLTHMIWNRSDRTGFFRRHAQLQSKCEAWICDSWDTSSWTHTAKWALKCLSSVVIALYPLGQVTCIATTIFQTHLPQLQASSILSGSLSELIITERKVITRVNQTNLPSDQGIWQGK